MTEEDPGPSPWRRHTRRLAYENAWLRVFHDEVVRPDGEAGIYGVVHFRNHAVAIVAIDSADRVILVGQWRYTLDAYSWEVPEGGVPAGEEPLDGARRELREETGLSAGHWREVARIAVSNSVTDELGSIFLATELEPGAASPEGTEQLRIRWVLFEAALAMIDAGQITDLLTIAALERVGRLRRAADPPHD
ncbi:MAG: NUDIX domain-containing protein [Candidatus Limnocylindrales bacterium]